jgi:hypothetical protein
MPQVKLIVEKPVSNPLRNLLLTNLNAFESVIPVVALDHVVERDDAGSAKTLNNLHAFLRSQQLKLDVSMLSHGSCRGGGGWYNLCLAKG